MFYALPTFVIYSCYALTPDNWATLNTGHLVIRVPTDSKSKPTDTIPEAQKPVDVQQWTKRPEAYGGSGGIAENLLNVQVSYKIN
jgi:hypothetical protein